MKRRALLRKTTLSVLLAGCALAIACGGGGGDGGGMIPGGVTSVVFTPAAAGDVALASAGSSGANFSIDVRVNAIDELYTAAFRVNYDPATATFIGHSSAGSILTTPTVPAPQTFFKAELLQGAPGQIAVVAALVGQGYCSAATASPPGPGTECSSNATCPSGACLGGINNATGKIVTLSFQATQATTLNAFSFLAAGREVTVCPVAGQTCTNVAPVLSFTGGAMAAN